MRILFVQPAPFEPGRLGLENAIWLSEPAAFTSLAAMVPEHACRILDLRLEPDSALNRELLAFRPDVVAVSCMTTDSYQAMAILQCAKNTLGADKVFCVAGGHHPSLAPWDFHHVSIIDAIAIGEGEETFKELCDHLAAKKGWRALQAIDGLCFFDGTEWVTTTKRAQSRTMDSFPLPNRSLLKKYGRSYFFMSAMPMASLSTSRGCAYDCNFCGIWEFYEKKVRFLSAERICDALETMDETFVMFLDDNFLTSKKRLEELCDEIEKRGIKKLYGAQGRADFVVKHPELMARLRKVGLSLLISGYETNDEAGLAALKKSSVADANKTAAKMLNDLGIAIFGIFMVRPDFTHADFDFLYKSIDEMRITLPIITIHTPLPGTQLRKALQGNLLTEDVRFFDLLHAVTPTRLPREEFYTRFTEGWAKREWRNAPFLDFVKKRPDYMKATWRGLIHLTQMLIRYRPVATSPDSHLRDEIGIIPADLTLLNAREKAYDKAPIKMTPPPTLSGKPGLRIISDQAAE
ncbi:MAG: radical SAM protein [Deltaproteobacteria bacterium]|nr:radical SAM protein [Deltaproteobacteria bacterium]